MEMRREVLTWHDVDKLIDHLIPQFEREYTEPLVLDQTFFLTFSLSSACQLSCKSALRDIQSTFVFNSISSLSTTSTLFS